MATEGAGGPLATDDGQPRSDAIVAVEVAYADRDRQLILQLEVPAGTTVAQAIELSGIRGQFPQIEPQPVVGIFGRKVTLDDPLSPGDRVEIYRPLLVDPKETRRRKALQEKLAKKTGR